MAANGFPGSFFRVTHKSDSVADRVAAFQGRDLDARYLGYFDCFNREQFYEGHDVLEDLWLLDRKGPDGNFYKGLIQLAGAFVHLQKGRLQPAVALLRLTLSNLVQYPTIHHRLDLAGVLELLAEWEARILAVQANGAVPEWNYPKLVPPASKTATDGHSGLADV